MNKNAPAIPKSQVLIVDDEAVFRYLAKEALLQSGFRVLEAENGKQALDLFENRKPNIVLLDIRMPEMDGFTVCETIRKFPGGETVPIVMITASDDIDSVMKAYDVGATDFITKPVNWQMLGHRVNFLLRTNKEFLDEIKKSIKNINLEKYLADKNATTDKETVEINDTLYTEFLALEKEIGPVILYELISVIKTSANDINRKELDGGSLFRETYKSKFSIDRERFESIQKKFQELTPNFSQQVIQRFLDRSAKIVGRLSQFVKEEHYADLILDALQLKIYCKFLGFERLYELCSYIEGFDRKVHIDDLNNIVIEICSEVNLLREELSNPWV